MTIKSNDDIIFSVAGRDPLAQSVEHLTFNQGVRSSNLRWVTKNYKIIVDNQIATIYNGYHATVAELADAPDLGSGIHDVGVQVSSVAPDKTTILCGSGSVVERCLAKANVAGPNPVSRSNRFSKRDSTAKQQCVALGPAAGPNRSKA